jgi:hypothetical protein
MIAIATMAYATTYIYENGWKDIHYSAIYWIRMERMKFHFISFHLPH